jgi:soluble lytic murein transglycosylase-like protein
MGGLIKTKRIYEIVLLLVLVALPTGRAAAQSSEQGGADDPAKRAMERIEKALDARAAAAERAAAAAGLVNESGEARRQGDSERARKALRQAETILAATPGERGLLTEEVLRRIAAEQAALMPSSSAPPAKQGWPGLQADSRISRVVLARYDAYRDGIARILAEERLPAEAVSVALIESGFNPQALSPKGARGIWQLMPATARRYGLTVASGNDHRTHPEHATRAAARYLRDLYQMFGDWKLALAAYNAGEGRVQQAISRAGARDFDELARRRLLPLETRNYVPAVLAAWAQISSPQAMKPARKEK